jgi:y4mF family transcriptional regulator
MKVNEFVKEKRRKANLTQPQLAEKAGVGLRFLRELEQGKETLRIDKINQVLKLFGHELGAVQITKESIGDEKG